jgi:hypothetical protein
MPAHILWPGVSNWWPDDCIWPNWFTAADKYVSNIALYKQTCSIVHHNISSNYFFFHCPFIFQLATILLHFQELLSFFAQYVLSLAKYLLTSVITHELIKRNIS